VRGRVVIREQADAEIDEIAAYIARDNLEAGRRFYDATWAAFDLLSRMPGMGRPRRARNLSLKGLRSWSIRGYENYLIFYLPLKDGIEVVHVLHGARNVEAIIERG
jgi:toxin ParE1/3/4